MGTLSDDHQNIIIPLKSDHHHEQICAIMVPLPAQAHLNQMLHLSALISSYGGIPVHFAASATHNRQAKSRVNALNPHQLAGIHFHDLPMAPFPSPPPNPHSANRYPTQLLPAFYAALSLRLPFSDLLRRLAATHARVIVIHDNAIPAVVQDVNSVPNAESYAFSCASSLCSAIFVSEYLGKPSPLPLSENLPQSFAFVMEDILKFCASQSEENSYRSGDLYNTCRVLEAPFLDLLESEEVAGNRKTWAIGPIFTAIFSHPEMTATRHECLRWLDGQEPNSVMYVAFGTTTPLTDEEIAELANGLENSKQKFLWVLRDADRGNVFDGETRRPELPPGFEERVAGVGMVVRDWAPQPEILAHKATGGFMNHCGWTSCLEGFTMGVPMATCPMHSDQPANAVLITEILKVGLAVRKWDEGGLFVKATVVENVVKRLMASEEGEEIRKRAEDLAAAVRQATMEEGGVSRVELDSFIKHITRPST